MKCQKSIAWSEWWFLALCLRAASERHPMRGAGQGICNWRGRMRSIGILVPSVAPLHSLSPPRWKSARGETRAPGVWGSGSGRTWGFSSFCWSWRGCPGCGTAGPENKTNTTLFNHNMALHTHLLLHSLCLHREGYSSSQGLPRRRGCSRWGRLQLHPVGTSSSDSSRGSASHPGWLPATQDRRRYTQIRHVHFT